VLAAEGVRLCAAGDVVGATETLERAFAEVRRAKVRVSHVVQIPLLLSGALRARAAKLPPWSTAERATLLARARHVMRIGLRAARRFQNYLPFALREAGALAAIEGDRKGAVRLLEASERIARHQGARFELARTSWLLAQIADPAAIEDARRQLIELGAGFELASSEKPVVLSLADRFARLLDELDEDGAIAFFQQLPLDAQAARVIGILKEARELGDRLNAMDRTLPVLPHTEITACYDRLRVLGGEIGDLVAADVLK